MSQREHKKTSLEIFIPDLCEFLYDDFGGGFRKAKVPDDLFAWMLCLWVAGLPRKTGSFLTWHWRRYNKVPYDKDEILYLTSSTLGVAFDVLEKEEVEEVSARSEATKRCKYSNVRTRKCDIQR